jgi:hypothetical protein
MRVWPLALAVCAIALGARCVQLALAHGDGGWRLFETPMPSPGVVTSEIFQVGIAGRFRLEATVPDASGVKNARLPDRPPVTGLLRLEIQREGTPPIQQDVKVCRYSGRYFYGQLDYYACDMELPLNRGSYTARLIPLSDFNLFRTNGAVLSLTRVAEPSGWAVVGMFYRVAGFVLLGVGGLLVIAYIGVQLLRGSA